MAKSKIEWHVVAFEGENVAERSIQQEFADITTWETKPMKRWSSAPRDLT